MNSRRGSTSSPMSMVNTRSASMASPICTCSRLRTVGSIVVSHRSEEHTSELQSHSDLVCRLLLEKKKKNTHLSHTTLYHLTSCLQTDTYQELSSACDDW